MLPVYLGSVFVMDKSLLHRVMELEWDLANSDRSLEGKVRLSLGLPGVATATNLPERFAILDVAIVDYARGLGLNPLHDLFWIGLFRRPQIEIMARLKDGVRRKC